MPRGYLRIADDDGVSGVRQPLNGRGDHVAQV